MVGAATESERVDLMAREVEDRIDKRALFSRRRAVNDEKDVTSINERNRVFNQKLERNYAKYSNEIKGNLERGTPAGQGAGRRAAPCLNSCSGRVPSS